MIATARSLGVTLLERIGNTPLLSLERLTAHLPGVHILGKIEWVNPGGSIKDRAAASIVLDAEKRGLLKFHDPNGRALLDATSGNTGIAYAMLGAALGFPVTLCVPSNVSEERKNILSAYGAHVIWTDPADGSDGAIRKARTLAADHPDRYMYADQYGNEQNWKAHYRGTANEIWKQTEGQVTHFVAGLGTSGTFMGTTRRLKELNPKIQCISVQPDSPFNGFEGLKHMATAIVPPIYDAAPRRPQHLHGDGARLRHGPRTGQERRPAGRRLRGRSRRHLTSDRRRRGRRRTRSRHRHHPLRLRRQVPQRTLLAGRIMVNPTRSVHNRTKRRRRATYQPRPKAWVNND